MQGMNESRTQGSESGREPGSGAVPPIRVSERAIARIAEISRRAAERGEGGAMLRVRVEGGGCSGFRYDFALLGNTPELTGDERVLHFGEARVVVDEASLPLLAGSVLDYSSEMIGSNFVINNPNAASSCGCGVSFSI